MAKPPKKIPITSAPDTSVEVTRIVTHEPAGHLPHTGGSDPIGSIIRAPHSDAGNPSPNANQQPPGVTISNLPETVAALLEANMRAITWPAKNAHLLRAISNPRGLYESPDGDTYAHIADEGYFRVDRQADGRYRMHWPEGLGEAGPLLTQVEGQAYWRPAPSARPVPAAVSVETAANPSPPRPLPADQAAWLTNAQTTWDGMRYDKRKATYVDMEDGTTFMVRKHPEGGYQQASAHERNSLGARVEQIPGSKRWRTRPDDEQLPGPSKRARLSAPQQPTLARPSSGLTPDAQPSTGAWRSWGKTSKPEWNDSIEIDGLHYVIVPQRMQADTLLVYLENPLFTPGRYDAFEQMLQTDLSLQPKWAVKTNDAWAIVEQRPFEGSLTGYVGKTFLDLSQQSSNAIARTVFNQANQSEVINGDGLRILFDTLYHWENRTTSTAPRPELADPLLLLPILPAQPSVDLLGHNLVLPLPSGEAFQRLDFDTSRFHQQWRDALDTPGASLRAMFSDLLEHSGYTVDRTSRMFSDDALLFKRENLDSVFVLRFRPSAADGTLYRAMDPASELTGEGFRSRVEKSKWSQMLEPGKVVYLVGGTQPVSAQQTLLFIVREG
ncbi:hypothetical protein [Pseudomonas sp. NPDC087817]|uniref:hypothetical protein n=1 Tax=Pseudomonas sp. NPDC087817 TaxID=3364451 RepID=UPI0028E8B65D|nr:hypothetical protein [uncultured Pseudomonas sp.]